MKSLKMAFAICAALAALLLITGSLLVLGRNSRNALPTVTSYDPSGTLAFRELLNQHGFRTDVTLSTKPVLTKDDLLVVFDVVKSADEEVLAVLSNRKDRTPNAITEHLKRGGRVLVLPVAPDFAESSRAAKSMNDSLHAPDSAQPAIPVSSSRGADPYIVAAIYANDAELEAPAVLWMTSTNEPFASLYRVSSGRLLIARDGLFATNRFLDQRQNARVALGLVRGLARKGARVIFDEAGIREPVEPGLLELIGPWAEAAWFQGLFLFAVVCYSLGKRFGLPEVDLRPQRGTRELLDAVADTFRRGKMTRAALSFAAEDAQARLRHFLHLPIDTEPRATLEHLPSPLQAALVNVRSAAEMKTSPKIARELAATLDREIQAFVGSARR